MSKFTLISKFQPNGDQPKAIDYLLKGLREKKKDQVLLGVTGSGKTFTVANVIERTSRPALVMAPNKTLAAQLYSEFKSLFPQNAVEYFVSYYDYYQPEAYIPTSDTYIQKDSSINEMIDKLRHSATRSVLSRRDVIVVASVSCIFGLGSPEEYLDMRVTVNKGTTFPRDRLLFNLISIHYERNDIDFHRGVFRVRGDRVDIFPSYEEDKAVRIEFFGDEIDAISEIDPLRGTVLQEVETATIFPASHYVTRKKTLSQAVETIIAELKEQIQYFREKNCLLEAQRLEERTNFDLEMMQELGYCNGIENYSRHLTGRHPGEPPPTLMDYFPDDFITFIDESHISIPQIVGMYKGDRSRKETLCRYGFRLPSAMDNRPLKFEEFVKKVGQSVYISATPADYELELSDGNVVEQIARPTGLVDPQIDVRKAGNQVDDLYNEIRKRCERNERVLVTTLTKRMAEDLTDYYADLGIRVRYLHADIGTLERMEIVRDLRLGVFDVLVGINLLREGLDIPEVSLVAILDADKEGFLRSARSLIQTFGRSARNLAGSVIMYADVTTKSMKKAIQETDRRRDIQTEFNANNNVTPQSVQKEINTIFEDTNQSPSEHSTAEVAEEKDGYRSLDDIEKSIQDLEKEMKKAADNLEFEKAADIRDRIIGYQKIVILET